MQSVPIIINVKSLNPGLLRRGLLDTTLCDKVWQWLAGTTVSFTNKTDRSYITEIVLKVASSTITHSNYYDLYFMLHWLWLVWSCIFHALYLDYIKLLVRLSSMYHKMYGPGGRTYLKKTYFTENRKVHPIVKQIWRILKTKCGQAV